MGLYVGVPHEAGRDYSMQSVGRGEVEEFSELHWRISLFLISVAVGQHMKTILSY